MPKTKKPTEPPNPCPTCGHRRRTEYPARSRVYTVADIRAVMTATGSHWWDPSSFRFFRCRVDEGQALSLMPDGRLAFISSEQFEGSNGRRDPRAYTVRLFDPATWADSSLDDLGGFQAYPTLGRARTAIKAAGGVRVYESNAVELAEVTR